MIILTKLILAHLLGDFVLQTSSWVTHKEKYKWTSYLLFFHVAIHFALILIITMQPKLWLPALIIAGTHYVIDGLKLQFQKKKNRRTWFFLDQLLHMSVLLLVWSFLIERAPFSFTWNLDWQLITAIVFLTTPCSFLISAFMAKWAPSTEDEDSESLRGAGMYIGILERLFVLFFITTGQWSGVGFLLAAKSIFRFGDLTRAKDRKLTEYILIGTLLSFGLAMLSASIISG